MDAQAAVSTRGRAGPRRKERARDDLVSVPRHVLEEAAWAIQWCVDEHYAPDPSREKAALAALREAMDHDGRGSRAPKEDR